MRERAYDLDGRIDRTRAARWSAWSIAVFQQPARHSSASDSRLRRFGAC